MTLQAHTGELELLADQSVTVTATDTRIDVLAQKKIVLQAGKTAITLEGGNITFTCPGQFTVKAGEKPFVGPENEPAKLQALPKLTVGREAKNMSNVSMTNSGTNGNKSPPGGGDASVPQLVGNSPQICHERFVAKNSIDGTPVSGLGYRIKLPNGETISGVTDELGRTAQVATSTPQAVQLFWLDASVETIDDPDNCTEEC